MEALREQKYSELEKALYGSDFKYLHCLLHVARMEMWTLITRLTYWWVWNISETMELRPAAGLFMNLGLGQVMG